MPGDGIDVINKKDQLPVKDIWCDLIENSRKTAPLITAMAVDRANYYDNKLAKDPVIMKQRLGLIEFCNEAVNLINAASDKNKAVDFSKSPELQKLKEKGKEFKALSDKLKAEAVTLNDEAKALELEADQLEKNGKVGEANLKREAAKEKKELAVQKNSEAAELMDVVNALHTFSDKQYYTEAEKNALVQGLKSTADLLDKYNNTQITSSNRTFTERNNFYTEAMNLIRKLGDIILSIIRNVRGQ
jgi:hypothetical protein